MAREDGLHDLDHGQPGRRVEAFWVDAEFIGIDVPKSFAVDTAVDEMVGASEMVDAAIDAGW